MTYLQKCQPIAAKLARLNVLTLSSPEAIIVSHQII